MKWDGTTAYTTTEQKFNGRDQVLKTIQTDNVSNPIKTQEVTMTYDGHGRMKTRHYPIEDSLAYTEWIYNADDSIQQVIDPRLAITTFTYGDPRGLTTQVSYSVPNGSTIPVTPTTTFAYDNLGNRTSMATAGVNTTTYAYDQLSRMTSETVDFDALANNLTIGYTYNLSGGLKSITDPFNSTVNYTNDRGGRLTAVTGTAYAQNTTGDYASNIKYRAFGQVKQMDYVMNNGTSEIKLEYDSRLRVSHHSVTQAGSTTNFLMKGDFTYFADSRMQAKDDLLENKWDRTNKYDFAGRLTFNQFGMGPGSGGGSKRVYEQTIGYDGFSNMTTRWGVHWDNAIAYAATFANGRLNSEPGITFDATGNIIHSDGGDQWTYSDTVYDASGRRTGSTDSTKGRRGSILNWVSQSKNEYSFDGDGRPVVDKRGFRGYHINSPPSGSLTTSPYSFQIWSTVLGKSLTSITPAGNKLETTVFAGDAVIAKQGRFVENNTNYDSITWVTADPVTGSAASPNSGVLITSETEPLGQKLHPTDPAQLPEPQPNQIYFQSADDPQWQCAAGREFYGSFSAMPFHCQKRMLQDIDNTLEMIYEPEGIPETPKAVTHGMTDSPLPTGYSPDHGMSFASKSMMSFALTASSKKRDKEKDDDCGVGEDRKPCVVNVKDDEPRPLVIPDFRDASESGSGGSNLTDTCRLMVGKLREIMVQSLNTVGPIKDMAGVDRLVTEIDSAFFDFFVGQTTISSTQATQNNTPGRYSGSSGFKPEFKDSLNRYEDQTHHFAAYFHAGIWATESWKAYAHSLTDIATNDGDHKLGNAAFDLGVSLRTMQTGTKERRNTNNPRAVFTEKVPIYESWEDRKNRVFGISDAVLTNICD